MVEPWYATPEGMKHRLGYARREYRTLSAHLELARRQDRRAWARWLEKEVGRWLEELWLAQESLRTGVYLVRIEE